MKHIDDDAVRVSVLRIRENSFFVSIIKESVPKNYFLKISHNKKLIIKDFKNDYFEEKILELETQIIEIMNDFEEEYTFQYNGVWQIV